MRGSSLKLIWPPMEAVSMRAAYTAAGRYCLKVTSYLVILGIGDYDWGRSHVSVCTLEPQKKKTRFPLFTFRYWSFFPSFMVRGASIDVLWSVIQHTHTRELKGVWFIFHVKKTDASCRREDADHMISPTMRPHENLPLVLSGSLMNRTL